MRHSIPAAAQYAAKAAPVLPLDVAMHFVYEPDGLVISSLKYRFSNPRAGPMARDFTTGVFPSPREIRASDATALILLAHRQIVIDYLAL